MRCSHMHKSRKLPVALKAAAVGTAAAGILALANQIVARRTERRHPPEGSFIVVDGVRLHYSDRGHSSPVVLVHGDAVTGADWNTSGVADLLLAQGHRVVIFDRPGFGYSDRPRGRIWTAARQVELLYKALQQLGVERAVVVGHSWGAIVALALAAEHQSELSGLVAISGYYVWTLRPDVLPITLGALPGVGDLLRYTVSRLLGWLQMPLLKWQMFSPVKVPPRFKADYSTGMALRPSQIRATSEDGALMIPGALALRGRYEDLRLPVTIIAGEDDRVVWKRRAEELAEKIPGSKLQILPRVGHMVHYAAPKLIVRAVEAIASGSRKPVTNNEPSHLRKAGAFVAA